MLTLVGERDDVVLATGADLSPDGGRLAVSTYQTLWIFERPISGDNWLGSAAHRLELDTSVARQLEAVTWDDQDTLRLVNENRTLMTVPVAAFQAAADP